MRRWYAYTGKHLLVGEGRAIRHVAADSHAWQDILARAREHKAPKTVPPETFIAALAAVLASQEFPDLAKRTTTFSSMQQVFGLFDDLDIEQAALNIVNGRIASAYADADEVALGFLSGELWMLPRDVGRLHAKETLAGMPGAVAMLLARDAAERKSFASYLRRGTSPGVPAEMLKAIAKARPVLRTWEREARLEAERRNP